MHNFRDMLGLGYDPMTQSIMHKLTVWTGSIFLLTGLFLLPYICLAQVTPTDTIQYNTTILGNTATTLLTSTTYNTVLYTWLSSNTNSPTANWTFFCGATPILVYYSRGSLNNYIVHQHYPCNANISITPANLAAGDNTAVGMLYVPRDRNTTDDPFPQDITNTTIDPDVVTRGDFYTIAVQIFIAGFAILALLRLLFAKYSSSRL